MAGSAPIPTLDAVRAVMFFVDDPAAAATWWSSCLGLPVQSEDGFTWLDVGGVELGFHPADGAKNPFGSSTVPYWSVEDLDAGREAFLAAGCRPLRGPLRISGHRSICQLVDPFGNVFGLDGSVGA